MGELYQPVTESDVGTGGSVCRDILEVLPGFHLVVVLELFKGLGWSIPILEELSELVDSFLGDVSVPQGVSCVEGVVVGEADGYHSWPLRQVLVFTSVEEEKINVLSKFVAVTVTEI